MTPNNFRVKSGLTVGTTISGGNTTITGFLNVSGAANISSLAVGGTVLNSSTFAGTANNASFLGGTAASGYQTTAGLSANVATLTSNNSTNLGGSSLATIQGQITGNAATAYTNAIAIAANGSNITSGTVAFARLPSLFIGTTTIQSTSAAQAVSGITTLATGNTTITGFANVTSTIQGGSSLTIAGAASGITTLAAGNTTITGFANVTSTIQGGSSLTIAGAASGITTLAAGNTTITGFANVTTSIQGGSSLTIAGAASGITTLAAGNTTITGFANVTSTLQVGGISTFSGNVVLGSVGVSANGGFGTAGQVLHSNGTATYWAADDNSGGTVTSIATANGLSGGTITTTGTLGITTGSTLTVNTTGIHVNSALSIASLALSGDLTVSGNLTVSGTRTYVNTTTLDVGDNIFTLNADLGAVAPSQDAGIEIMRGTSANVQFLWDETNDRWSTNGQPIAVSSLVAAGAASGITTLAAGNTTITGFANVTSTLQVGGGSTFGGTVTLGSVGLSANGGLGTAGQVLHSNGTATYWAADDNSGGTVTSIATANGLTGGTITTTGTLGVASGSTLTVNTTGIHVNSALSITSLALAGALSGVTTAAMGNTTITGFANVTSTIQGGSSLTIAGALSGVTTAAMGNTTITGFANVTSTLQVGGVATFAANANFDSGVLFVDGTNNRVGISTTAPQTKMQIFGSNAPETGDAASTETMLTLTREGSASVWREGASFALGRWQTGGGSNPFSRLDINLKSVTDNSSLPNVTVMTLQDNGYVGIGTTTPGTSLQVAGGIRARGGSPGSGGANNNGYSFSGNSGDTDGGMFSSADGQLEFYTDSTEKMRIVANGNIGIGTTSPGVYKLNVNGQTYFADTMNYGSGGRISWTSGYSDGTTQTIESPTSGSVAILTNGTVGMFIKSNQNVGIGTNNPGYKLEVNGSFAATTKSFVIPHPTKPGMQLRYGSLEGPENGVYVRGRLKGGENIIQLPDYWEGLVDEDTYTVNLTPVGKHQELYVEHIARDHIVVGGENIDCFYTVFAERNDVEKLVVEF